MTNADVPTLAMEGVIDNPINPFTNKPIDNSMKYNGKMFVTDSRNWDITNHNWNTFDTSDGSWWSVHDNIYDMNNWQKEDSYE